MIERIAARAVIAGRVLLGPSVVTVGDDGRIISVEPTTAPTPDRTLVPGFIDLQVNGVDDIDVASASGAQWDRLSELLLAQGTTAWCPTLVSAPLDRYPGRIAGVAAAIDRQKADWPKILGIHLEGPFLGRAPGAHDRELIVPISLDWLATLPDTVRIVTVAAENPNAARATRLLTEKGIVVSIGHSQPSDCEVEACVAAGARMVTHLFNGMSGVHHRLDGLASFALDDDRLAAGLIADGVHVSDRAIRLAVAAKGPDAIALVTDAVAWRRGSVGDIRLTLSDGAPRLADGTLAGSALTMDGAIRHLVDRCRISLLDAVTMATSTPARIIGDLERGSIRVGARGDLASLDGDLGVAAVWLAGQQVR